MAQPTSHGAQITPADVRTWVQDIPEEAVSGDSEGAVFVFRASQKIQERFDMLLEKRKAARSPQKRSASVWLCATGTRP